MQINPVNRSTPAEQSSSSDFDGPSRVEAIEAAGSDTSVTEMSSPRQGLNCWLCYTKRMHWVHKIPRLGVISAPA